MDEPVQDTLDTLNETQDPGTHIDDAENRNNQERNHFERRSSGAPPRFRGSRGSSGGRFNARGRRGGTQRSRPEDTNHDMDDSRDYRFNDKLHQIGGPTVDLPPIETETGDRKFLGRNRLYIGNIGSEVTESELSEQLGKFGEFAELFFNRDKSFAFVKFDYYCNAEKAKAALDGTVLGNKTLKVRFAPNSATVKVKNLPQFVSNELLYHAFQIFGDIDRALVCVDERGKPTGEGIVEFARKGSASSAIRKCSERCLYITEALRPCIVEAFEIVNENDGIPEKSFPKRNPDYLKARGRGPRMAEPNSFEHEYGVRWKQLLELHEKKVSALKQELQIEQEKLEAQMEYARYEHETQMLREELRMRELGRERQKQEWEMKERQVEEQRRRTEENLRRQEERLLQCRVGTQDEELRRRQQEDSLFMQARQLSTMLEEQEQSYGNEEGFTRREEVGMQEDSGDKFAARQGRERWVTDRRDDFPAKRRRF